MRTLGDAMIHMGDIMIQIGEAHRQKTLISYIEKSDALSIH